MQGGTDMEKNITIRPERVSDYQQVEDIIRQAFYNLYTPGCTEHYLAHAIRPHPDFLPEGDLGADGHLLTELEVCNGLASTGDNSLLAGVLTQIAHNIVQHLRVFTSLAAAHVDNDLVDFGDLHDGLVTELLHQSGSNFGFILFLQSCHLLSRSFLTVPHRSACTRGSSCRPRSCEQRGYPCCTWGRQPAPCRRRWQPRA